MLKNLPVILFVKNLPIINLFTSYSYIFIYILSMIIMLLYTGEWGIITSANFIHNLHHCLHVQHHLVIVILEVSSLYPTFIAPNYSCIMLLNVLYNSWNILNKIVTHYSYNYASTLGSSLIFCEQSWM